MKYLSFLIVLSVFACYGDLCPNVYASAPSHHSTEMGDALHTSQHPAHMDMGLAASHDVSMDTRSPSEQCDSCQDALLGSADKTDWSLFPAQAILHTAVAGIDATGLNAAHGYLMKIPLIRKHAPPELFLNNSTFLL